MKSKQEIIQEIADYYSADVTRRSMNSKGTCAYDGINGNMCAFRRVCKDDADLYMHEGECASTVLERVGIDILKDEYKINDSIFWDRLQHFHDADAYWCADGLTDDGRAELNTLLSDYIGLLEDYTNDTP